MSDLKNFIGRSGSATNITCVWQSSSIISMLFYLIDFKYDDNIKYIGLYVRAICPEPRLKEERREWGRVGGERKGGKEGDSSSFVLGRQKKSRRLCRRLLTTYTLAH